MSDSRIEKPRAPWRRWVNANTIGIAVLVCVILSSIVRVMSIQEKLFDPNKRIIRISHWQLELGYRNAVQAVIDEYEKLHPDVNVIQMPVTEKVYGQWLNVHLISGTAPDMAEIGFAKMATDQQYLARFFMPLTELIDKPNPYNKGTDIEELPWRETFITGMRGGYKQSLQDYFSAPTSMFTVRLFYNRPMLKEATGSDAPPRTLEELFQACDQLRKLGREKGVDLAPIAGSRYNVDPFRSRYRVPFTAGPAQELDLDLDGSTSPNEAYIAFMQGKVGMRSPPVRAYYKCMQQICSNFVEGFTGFGRETAASSFVRGRSAMIATGSWDAMSLFKQAKFEVGVVDFPMPTPGKRWGEFVVGRSNEAGTAGGGQYGIYKFSRHRDLAVDFLRFLTSRDANQLLNRKAEWLPVVLGAKPSDRMLPFVPDPRGFSGTIRLGYGSYAGAILEGELERYLLGEISDYEVLASKVEAALRDKEAGGDKAWAIEYDTMRRWCRNQDRVLAVHSLPALMKEGGREAARKHARALLQQVRKNNGEDIRFRFEQIHPEPIPKI